MILVDIHTLKIIVSMDRLKEYKDYYNFDFDYFETFEEFQEEELPEILDRLKEYKDYYDFDFDCFETFEELQEEELPEILEYNFKLRFFLTFNIKPCNFKIVINQLGGVMNMIQQINQQREYEMDEEFITSIMYDIFINAKDEMECDFQLLLYYYGKVFYPKVILHIKERFIFYHRLHYNRVLKDSCLPDEICSKIREYL